MDKIKYAHAGQRLAEEAAERAQIDAHYAKLGCPRCAESDGNGHPGGSCCVACMEEGDGQ